MAKSRTATAAMARALGLEPGSRVILRLEEGRIVLLPLELGLKTPDAVLAGTAPAAGCGAVVGNDGLCAQRPTEAAYLYLSAHVPA